MKSSVANLADSPLNLAADRKRQRRKSFAAAKRI